MKVNLIEFRRCVEYFKEIDEEEFSEIKWMLNGEEKLPKSKDLQETRDEWKFIGLSNVTYGKLLLDEVEP